MSMATNLLQFPPRGFYLAAEVGQLAGVSGDQIGQWARRGYIRSSQSEDSPRVYSFQDVAEAMVVHELLDRSVEHRAIRWAIETLRTRYGDWPLTTAPLATAGSSMILQEGEDIDIQKWRQVLLPGTQDLKRIRDQLHRGGWVVRELSDLTEVEVDPDRLSGRPTVRDRRIPVEDVAKLADTADGRQVLLDDYELSDRQIRDAVRWYEAVLKHAA